MVDLRSWPLLALTVSIGGLLYVGGEGSGAIPILVAGGFVAGVIDQSWRAALVPVVATVATMIAMMLTTYPWGPSGQIHIDIVLLGIVFGAIGVPFAFIGAAVGRALHPGAGGRRRGNA
jgi:hypothetical protein